MPDEKIKIQAALRRMTLEYGASLVITTGGTGLSPRDITPEAIEEIADRVIPGIGECLRQSGARHIDTAWLSRSLGAMIGKSWVIALPGSERAVREGWMLCDRCSLTVCMSHAEVITRDLLRRSDADSA